MFVLRKLLHGGLVVSLGMNVKPLIENADKVKRVMLSMQREADHHEPATVEWGTRANGATGERRRFKAVKLEPASLVIKDAVEAAVDLVLVLTVGMNGLFKDHVRVKGLVRRRRSTNDPE